MAQSLEVNIKTTSDVPQAMDKAKAATTGFGAQVEGIGKKFATSFKDIFLSFLGPMALVTAAFAYIGKIIAENQKAQEDANQAAINNTNILMSKEDNYYANKKAKEQKNKEEFEQAKRQRLETTEQFLASPEGAEITKREMKKRNVLAESSFIRGEIAKDPKIQNEVRSLIAKEMADTTPVTTTPTGPTSFKTPEGFGNVVGVGANPVMEAMTMQLEESRKQTALLETISRGNGGGVPTDFTKSPIPSRASMLKGGN
jgi:hypothetical protein